MIPSDKKIERMIRAARLYYEKDMTQSQIAREMGISRPLVSILLTEAKACGIVTFQIHDVDNPRQLMVNQLENRFSGVRVKILGDESSPDATDDLVAKTAFQLCFHQQCTAG